MYSERSKKLSFNKKLKTHFEKLFLRQGNIIVGVWIDFFVFFY